MSQEENLDKLTKTELVAKVNELQSEMESKTNPSAGTEVVLLEDAEAKYVTRSAGKKYHTSLFGTVHLMPGNFTKRQLEKLHKVGFGQIEKIDKSGGSAQ